MDGAAGGFPNEKPDDDADEDAGKGGGLLPKLNEEPPLAGACAGVVDAGVELFADAALPPKLKVAPPPPAPPVEGAP